MTNCSYTIPGDAYQYDMYWMVDQIKRLSAENERLHKELHELDERQRSLAKDQCAVTANMAAVHTRLDEGDFNTGDYHTWAAEHLEEIVHDAVRFIGFGLSEDGRLVAYVPETWSFLRFDTVNDPTSKCFGRLVINY